MKTKQNRVWMDEKKKPKMKYFIKYQKIGMKQNTKEIKRKRKHYAVHLFTLSKVSDIKIEAT